MGEKMTDAKQETMGDALARWAGTPGDYCDICGVPIQHERTYRVPNSEFRGIVEMGYDPFARGHVDTSRLSGLVLAGDAYGTWKERAVLTFTTDWDLCRACARDVARFVTRS